MFSHNDDIREHATYEDGDRKLKMRGTRSSEFPTKDIAVRTHDGHNSESQWATVQP